MIKKDRIDYRLVNIALVVLIIYLLYKTGYLWMGIIDKFFAIITPFIIGFALAYALHPFVEKLQAKRLKKGYAVAIVVALTFLLVGLVIYVFTKILVGQISDLFGSINSFMNEISSMDLNIDITSVKKTISSSLDNVIEDIAKYVSNGAIKLIGTSINWLGKLLIGAASYVYFLIDMDKIRFEIKRFFRSRSIKTFKFVKLLDEEMRKYLSGLVKVMIISVFEYGIAYSIIGHPYAILLGFMAGIANLIPYFGGIGNNILASITAFTVSPALFVRTLITFFILSSVDSYVINPHVYGKTNSIHPLLTIFSLFAGSLLFGITGVFISFPMTIIFVTSYKYYKEDIAEGFEKLRSNIGKDKYDTGEN